MHFINLLSCAAQQKHTINDLQLLINQGKGYLVDSKGNSPAYYLQEKGNLRAQSDLFKLMADEENQIEFDIISAMQGYSREKQWIMEDSERQVFKKPYEWSTPDAIIKKPLFGYIKGGSSQITFLSNSRYISKDLLSNFLDFRLDHYVQHEIEIKVSTVRLDLTAGSDTSIDFLDKVQSLNDETFYTTFG